MLTEDLFPIIYSIVEKKYRHPDYERTVELANKYRAFITGEGLDPYLQRFVPTEPDDLFQQRVRITKHIVSGVCKNLIDVAFKVPRSNSITKVIGYVKDKEEQRLDLIKTLSKFNGDEGNHDDYMGKQFIELSYIDPNAFLIIEWPKTDGKNLAQPYPLEMLSESVLDLKYDKKVLQYLICSTDIGYVSYLKDRSVIFTKVNPELIGGEPIETTDTYKVVVIGQIKYLITSPQNVYQITETIPHNFGFVPAVRVGYYSDLVTRTSYVNPIHYAFPTLEKTLKLNSEFDLTAALVAHPQKIQYVREKCDYDGCYEGKLKDGTTCPQCKGTGIGDISTSVQHVLTIPFPKDKDEFYPLDQLMVYKSPDVSILEWQEKAIDRLTEKCRSIVFNTDIFDRAEIADTATGKNIDLQNVYDSLYAFALKFSRVWEFIVETSAKIIQRDKGLVCLFSFSKDFKMKSIDQLIADLGAANTANAGPAITSHITNDIMRIIYEDAPESLKRFETREFYNPFSGKTPNEILMLLGSSTLTTQYNKILYVHLNDIFDTLEVEQSEAGKDFYKLDRKIQMNLIKEKVDAIVKEVNAMNPDPNFLTDSGNN